MVGEHLGEVLDPLTGFRLDPPRPRGACRSARAPGDLAVSDVANQHVPEGVLGLALDRRGRAAGRTSSLRESSCRASSRPRPRPAPPSPQGPRPEDLPQHRGILEQRLAVRRRECPGGRRSAPGRSGEAGSRRRGERPRCALVGPGCRGRSACARTPRRRAGYRRPARRGRPAPPPAGPPARAGLPSSSAVSSAVSGARLIVVALRLPPAQSGWRSYSSGRAVQTRKSGTPSDQSARCSRKSRSAASAQCRSSKTRHGRRSSAIASRKRRQAVKDSSRSAPRPRSRPTRASRRADPSSHSRSGRRLGRARSSLAATASGASDSRMPGVGLHDFAERPKGDALPVRQAATLHAR